MLMTNLPARPGAHGARRRLIRLALAALLLPAGPLLAQEGPTRDTGDTVAKPKKKDTTEPEPTDRTKIPSKLSKKGDAQAPGPGSPTFRADITTVNVDVGVLDNRGRFIPGIPPGNFRIMEDGVPQKITNAATGEVPITICMVIEFSGRFQRYWSMGWMQTLQAVYGFLQFLKPEDQVAVVAFDLRTTILSDFSNNRQDTQEALARLRIPGFSESNMFDALTEVADRMSAIEGRKAVFYVGSGMDTFSRITLDECRRKLQTAGVPVYSLGTMQIQRMYATGMAELDYLQAENELKTFGKETGGQAWFPRFPGELPGIFQSLNQALRNTYMLSYSPTNTARDGKFRKIKVDLVSPTGEALRITDEKGKPMKYAVIAKTGYTAPREVE
ncbi:MAG: VWA domain-containing protein [Bryobacteraceae bacterium]